MTDVLKQRARELIQQHGGYRAAARVLKTDVAHLYRIANNGSEPSDKLARRMGLKRIVTYQRK